MLTSCAGERRAITVRLGGEQRWIDAADAGLYRDALGAAPPGGLPGGVPRGRARRAAARWSAATRATHGPFTTAELRERYGVDCRRGAERLERAGELVRGELRPGGTEREWCDPEVLRRLRRASLAVLRKEIEPVDQRGAGALPARAGRASTATRRRARAIDRLREVLVPLQGLALPAEVWERDVLPRRVGAYSPAWMDQLCAAARSSGSAPARSAATPGRVALYFREDLAMLGPPAVRGAPPPESPRPRSGPRAAGRRRVLLHRPARRRRTSRPRSSRRRCGIWSGPARSTNDAFAPLRAPRLTLARAQRERDARTAAPPGGSPPRRRGGGALGAGPGPLVADRAAVRAPAVDPAARRRALARAAARALRDPDPRAGAGRGRARRLLGDLLGAVAARDARGRPAGLLRRGARRRPVRAAGRGRAAARASAERRAPPIVLAAVDPAQPYGAALPWPSADDERGRRPARAAGAYVVLVGGEPIAVPGARRARAADARRRPDDARLAAGAGGAGRARPRRRDQAAGAREGRRRAGDELAARPGAAGARLPGRAAAADASSAWRRCPRATRSPTRPTGSARCWRATVPDEIATPQPRHAARSLAGAAGRPRGAARVDTHGKHLFLRFEGDLVLHSHLRHDRRVGRLRRRAVAGRRSPRRAWLVLRRRRPRGGRSSTGRCSS